MARVPRTRSRMDTHVGVFNRYSSSGALIGSLPVQIQLTSTISDRVGRPVVPSPLDFTQYKGAIVGRGQYRRVDKATGVFLSVPLLLGEGEVPPALVLPSIPSGWELTTVARSNPSRPVVYPFEIVESIIQLPRMLKGLLNLLQHPKTRLSPKGVSSEYLGLQFGWLPLIDDFRKIVNCQSYILKRSRMINDLYSGKGLRRRVKFSETTATYAKRQVFAEAYPTAITFRGSQTRTTEVWATIRWYPTAKLPFYGDSDPRYHAFLRNLVLGLTPEGMAMGAWKIIPWTWLLGWFSNVGDYLAVNSNTVPASYGKACLMRRVTDTWTPASATAVGVEYFNCHSDGTRVRTLGSRVVGTGILTPGFNMPFLDMFRLSILGSLAIQRIR